MTLFALTADKYVITESSTSGYCTVQLETSRPYLGEVIGTCDSKDEADKRLKEFIKDGTCLN